MKRLLTALLFALALGSPAWSAVNINTATEAQLEAVRGIGPTKAKAIVAHRQKYGSFKSLDELEKVKGFGKASVTKLGDQLTVRADKPAPVK
jgi:competence protein ComEA